MNNIEGYGRNRGPAGYSDPTAESRGNLRSTSGPNHNSYVQFTAAINTTSELILPENRYRIYLMLQNSSASDIFISFSNARNNGGFKISPGGFYELDGRVGYNSIYGYSDGTNQQLTVIEGSVER